MPRRLRVLVPRITRDRRSAAALRARLRRTPGVVAVAASPVTGSVAIEYDDQAGRREAILRRFEEIGLPVRAAPAPARAAPAARLAEICAEVVLELCLERALRAAVAGPV